VSAEPTASAPKAIAINSNPRHTVAPLHRI
jgi:hypothetical protein